MYAIPYNLNAGLGNSLQSIQSGEVNIPDGNGSATVSISAINALNKGLLFFSYDSGAIQDDARYSAIRGRINTTSQLIFSRAQTSNWITIRWFVIEFKATSSVIVQRGSQTITSTTTNVTIAASALANSFPVVSYEVDRDVLDQYCFFEAEITSTTNLQLRVAAQNSQVVDWQVVTHPSWNVAKYTGYLTGLTLNTTITSVILANAMLVSSASRVDTMGADRGDCIPTVRFTTQTNIQAARSESTFNFDLVYYVITSYRFKNQHHTYSLGIGSASGTKALSPNINVSNSFLLMTCADVCTGSNTLDTEDRANENKFKHQINSTSQIQGERWASGKPMDAAVTVLDFSNV